MEKITKSERVIKDLSFLLDLKEEELIPGLIYKYKMEEGDGQFIKDITLPCSVYLTFTRFHSHLINVSNKHPGQKDSNVPRGVYEAMLTMKVGEKSWLNITKEELHETPGLQHKGCHFEVIINDIRYKNSPSLESKRLINTRTREEGKALYKEEKYEEAIRKYKNIINISEGLEKGKYSPQELNELEEMNLKAKQNFLRCFIKMSIDSFDDNGEKIARGYADQLLEKRKQNELSLYLKANLLFHLKYLDDGLEYAKKGFSKYNSAEMKQLCDKIQAKIKK